MSTRVCEGVISHERKSAPIKAIRHLDPGARRSAPLGVLEGQPVTHSCSPVNGSHRPSGLTLATAVQMAPAIPPGHTEGLEEGPDPVGLVIGEVSEREREGGRTAFAAASKLDEKERDWGWSTGEGRATDKLPSTAWGPPRASGDAGQVSGRVLAAHGGLTLADSERR